MALPSTLMKASMKLIHLLMSITGKSFKTISSPILKFAWFLTRNKFFIGLSIIIMALYYFDFI